MNRMDKAIGQKRVSTLIPKVAVNLLQSEAEEANLNKVRSKKTMKKYEERQKTKAVEQALEEQFATGRVLGICLVQYFRAVLRIRRGNRDNLEIIVLINFPYKHTL